MINFFKTHIYSIIIIGVLLFFLMTPVKKNNKLLKKIDSLEKLNVHNDKKVNTLLLKIDSLSNIEQKVVKEIEVIFKNQKDEINKVDTMPISELQQFFTNRYQK